MEEGGHEPGKDSREKKNKGAILGSLGVLGIAAFKFKSFLLVGLSSFKFAVFFKSFFSMFLMLGLYTVTFGWTYAFIVVGILLIHEMGHYIWMKRHGLEPHAPIFVPFLGAAVAMGKMPDNQAVNAWVAMAGPMLGGYTSILFYYIGAQYGLTYLMAAGWTGVMLNLFQLIPVRPFDGGFITGAISKWFMLPGALMIFTLAMLWQTPLMFIIALLAGFSVFRAFTGGGLGDLGVKPATAGQKFAIGATYLVLALSLGYIYSIADANLVSVLRK
ncbi:MAG TPA: site-2 protease family protein [Candidatus Obscuribacter sp.]|nr:site-2 protease family protein [Candidatus Obscuribacter sp.]HMY51584.1 site-2 protease family protein [Candidatus Obscuribacter sp.]HNA73601.1 site-2 protease family protein [Candidatus Obscuribacter sp.]HNB17045.1 site-2 protease family protein [Candidatus Obscuribacter sp.]HND05292.1 site-2 protease family protein [Candidatus Obscuribacter sp.]